MILLGDRCKKLEFGGKLFMSGFGLCLIFAAEEQQRVEENIHPAKAFFTISALSLTSNSSSAYMLKECSTTLGIYSSQTTPK